jgi:hypothetical protein
MRTAALVAAVVSVGCEPDPGSPLQERAAIDPHGWVQADPTRDVYASMRPADATCVPVDGFGNDWLGSEPSLEINTGSCNYLTVAQPLLVDVRAGDPMKLRLWHFELFSMEPDARAYLGVALEGEHAWETTVPIPGPSELVVGEWEAPVDADAGAELQFHLNNHGINSWDLLSITVTN